KLEYGDLIRCHPSPSKFNKQIIDRIGCASIKLIGIDCVDYFDEKQTVYLDEIITFLDFIDLKNENKILSFFKKITSNQIKGAVTTQIIEELTNHATANVVGTRSLIIDEMCRLILFTGLTTLAVA